MNNKQERILELIRWNALGESQADNLAKELSNNNSFKPVGKDKINILLRSKGYPLQGVRNVDYFVYYNHHNSSGYSTDIFLNNGKIEYKVISPKGIVFCAFCSEVIIFTLTDKWL